MDIEEFYDANPARRTSEEFEFGRNWSDAQDNRGEISWIRDTGELYVMTAPVEPIVTDPLGDEYVQALPTKAVHVDVLGVIPTLERVEALLVGWSAAMDQAQSLNWVQDRLASGPPTAAESAMEMSWDDEPIEIGGAGTRRDTTSVVITTLLKGFHEILPEDDQAKLASYKQQVATISSTPTLEWHRAYRCARWASQVVSAPAHHALAAEAKKAMEVVREVGAAVGSEFLDLEELPLGRAVSARLEVELAWVHEAVRVATKVGAKNGWSALPWEQLVHDLFSTAGH